MKNDFKPDIERVMQAWDHFWAGEVMQRPIFLGAAPKPGEDISPMPDPHYLMLNSGRLTEYLDWHEEALSKTYYAGELVPAVSPDFGPDQFAAFMGTRLEWDEESPGTNWAKPIAEDWDRLMPLAIDEGNPVWTAFLDTVRAIAERGRGRWVCSVPDLHSNADALSALRHPDRLCLDYLDEPELMQTLMEQVSDLYSKVYEAAYGAGNMRETGTTCWEPYWCRDRYATVQCDFSCFVGPNIFREFLLPAIEAEIEYLDHSVYHLDGTDALRHLDDLLAIPKLDAIQWVPGAGKEEMWKPDWYPVLDKIRAAGKGIVLYGDFDLDALKELHRHFGPENVVYRVYGRPANELDAMIDWLEKNT